MESNLKSYNDDLIASKGKRLPNKEQETSTIPRKKKKIIHIQNDQLNDKNKFGAKIESVETSMSNKQYYIQKSQRIRCHSDSQNDNHSVVDIIYPSNFKSKTHSKDPLHLKADLINARNASKNLALKHRASLGESADSLASPTKQAKRKRLSVSVNAVVPPKEPDFTHKQNHRQKDQRYIYGNYTRYYGYRSPAMSHDLRLDCMSASWFEGKEILDVGCNTGQVTLEIARLFKPSRITGIDRDVRLVHTARKSVRHELSKTSTYPKSMEILYGPLAADPVETVEFKYPHNVLFAEENYVLANDVLLSKERPQYDAILALSITKWVHLNDGDDGLKRFFKRIYLQLKYSGKFILEPQSWTSYKHKKNLTAKISYNFKNIKLKPNQFKEYLLSEEIGFSQCLLLDTPFNKSKGFRREIYVFTKKSAEKVKEIIHINDVCMKIEESTERDTLGVKTDQQIEAKNSNTCNENNCEVLKLL